MLLLAFLHFIIQYVIIANHMNFQMLKIEIQFLLIFKDLFS